MAQFQVCEELSMKEKAFSKFPNPQSVLVRKIRFKNQVTTCSDFPSEAVVWIKEKEMVDSLDELTSSRSVSGKDFPNFEMLDAKIASALNKIISVRKETVAVSATRPKIVRKKTRTRCRHTFQASRSRGRSVSRKRSIRGKSNHGSILRQPCRSYLKGNCTRTSCKNWHPPECQFYKNETGCQGGDKCVFPHYKVGEQPYKRPKKGNFPRKKRK